jgi:hypothetical protein
MSADGHAYCQAGRQAGRQMKSLPLDPWMTTEPTPHPSNPATIKHMTTST